MPSDDTDNQPQGKPYKYHSRYHQTSVVSRQRYILSRTRIHGLDTIVIEAWLNRNYI